MFGRARAGRIKGGRRELPKEEEGWELNLPASQARRGAGFPAQTRPRHDDDARARIGCTHSFTLPLAT